jgi:hypothetical protein
VPNSYFASPAFGNSSRSSAIAKTKKDPIRENRISDEVIVDAYGPEEQAMGWYYYRMQRTISLHIIIPNGTTKGSAIG